MSETTEGGLRQDMITTAVQFLQNQAVKNSAISQKRAFLSKKGLNVDEIEQAFKLAGTYQDEELRLSSIKNQSLALAPGRTVQAPQSRWIRFGKYVVIVAVAGGAAHWLYTMYKKYILPKLLNMAKEEDRISKVERELSEFRRAMGESMLQLSSSIAELSRAIQEQNRKVEGQYGGIGKEDWQYVQSSGMTELKQEVLSLKGLLLSRKQFPATPTLTGLPSWQVTANAKGQSDGSGDSTVVNGHAVNGKRDSDDDAENHSEDSFSSPSETPQEESATISS